MENSACLGDVVNLGIEVAVSRLLFGGFSYRDFIRPFLAEVNRGEFEQLKSFRFDFAFMSPYRSQKPQFSYEMASALSIRRLLPKVRIGNSEQTWT